MLDALHSLQNGTAQMTHAPVAGSEGCRSHVTPSRNRLPQRGQKSLSGWTDAAQTGHA